MSTGKGKYSPEFRSEAVELAEKIGIGKASKDLGINPANIRRWRGNATKARSAHSGAKSMEALESENRRLKKENEYLKKVGDVLKKSLGIVSRDSLRNLK